MDFRTCITKPQTDISITHADRVLLFGSCFSEHMGGKLQQHKFQVDLNPFGILYNPFSVSHAIRRLFTKRSFTEDELVSHHALYHSLMHHGAFSAGDPQRALRLINDRFHRAAAAITETDILLVTFGTSFLYRWRESGEIVANCHQFPANRFDRYRLTVEEIVEEWSELIAMLTEANRAIRMIFTVSPVRHWRDGAHENQRSKSILHLAIDALEKRFSEHLHYFPAYEVMMDDLRDYRFYDDDMLHPSTQAIDYIWNLFSETYFSAETRRVIDEWEPIRKALNHRPLHTDREAYHSFLAATAQKLEMFAGKHPEISCVEERGLLSLKNSI